MGDKGKAQAIFSASAETIRRAGNDAKRQAYFLGRRAQANPHRPIRHYARTWNHLVLVAEGLRATVYLNGGGEPEIVGDSDVIPADGHHKYLSAAEMIRKTRSKER